MIPYADTEHGVENRREGWAGDIHVGVVSTWIMFEARSLDETSTGMNLEREEKRVMFHVNRWGPPTFRGEGLRNAQRG